MITELKGFNHISESSISNEISDNLVEFFDWGLLQKGNYFNVTLGETDNKNVDRSRLVASKNNAFPKGKAWDSMKPNWVWQSGISAQPTPINVSGVYVNDVFQDDGYTIDYYNGRVIFDEALPVSSKVQVEHSHKYVHVRYANDFDGMRVVADEESFNVPENSIQTPCIAVEVVSRTRLSGYQLGGGQYVETQVLFHCLATTEIMRNRLVDIVSYQNDKTLILFDSNRIASEGSFPIDNYGSPVSGAMIYPNLVSEYPLCSLRLSDAKSSNTKMINNNLFGGIVSMKAEVAKLNI